MDRLTVWLDTQRAAGTLRRLRPLERLADGRVQLLEADNAPSAPLLDFSSNDYLAFSKHPDIIDAGRSALEKMGAGAGAARLMSGDLAIHHQLEQEIARLKGKEAALLFGSGYMANTGIIPALVGRHDAVFTDRLNHASIYDGCRLAGAKMVRFHHNDLNHLEELLRHKRGSGQALIIVESVYSMDGDCCPLKELEQLKQRYDCLLMVDEAHATGVFGLNGGGMIEQVGVGAAVDIAMGTFGKALGSYGAYAAASQEVINYLVNRARSFIFSTALPPAVVAASLAAVRLTRQQPELRRDLQARVSHFKQCLHDGGMTADLGPSQIIPIVVGDSNKAVALASELIGRRIFVTAVRPPTVPRGTARLRFSITRHLGREELAAAAAALISVLKKHAVIA